MDFLRVHRRGRPTATPRQLSRAEIEEFSPLPFALFEGLKSPCTPGENGFAIRSAQLKRPHEGWVSMLPSQAKTVA